MATWAQLNPEKAREWARENYRRKHGVAERPCIGCGVLIGLDAHGSQKFCSVPCRYAWQLQQRRERTRQRRAGRLCARCGEPIPTERIAKATTCSRRCRDMLNERRQMHIKCRTLTNYAIKVGRLVRQPCEICGTEDVEAHHLDYFEPLNVRWLCFVHHRNLMHGTSIEEGAAHG